MRQRNKSFPNLFKSKPCIKKKKYKEHIILFQMGDFYEMFNDDAKWSNAELGLSSTKRKLSGILMTGFPIHQLGELFHFRFCCFLLKFLMFFIINMNRIVRSKNFTKREDSLHL